MKNTFLLVVAFLISIILCQNTSMAHENQDSLYLSDKLSLRSSSLVDQQNESLRNSHKIIYIDGRPQMLTAANADSIRRIIDIFYYDQFAHFSDPMAPYFLFMSKDAGLAMGIGGCVRMRGWYDWHGAVPANGFVPYLIPMNPQPEKMRKFGTTPAGTALFFRVIGRNKRYGDYQIYIEANFNGYESRGFHLKKAYAAWNDWTVGYAESTFSDPMAVPPTVDANGPNNKISPTSVLIRWMHGFTPRWVMAASLETPGTQVSESTGKTKKVDEWLPDVAAFVQYQWGRSEHVRLSAIVRTLSYRDLTIGKNHNKMGWGVQLSGVAHPMAPMTLYGSVNAGQGYESLGGDLQVGKYDLVEQLHHPGKLYAPWAMGWNVGVQWNFRPNIFTTVTYSESRYLPSDAQDDNEYKSGHFAAANIFWNFTPRIMAGAEFDAGLKRIYNGEKRHAYRVGALVQFSF